MSDLLTPRLFAVSPDVRYVSIYSGTGRPSLGQRPGIADSSDSETDLYEELLVNPAILTLARQRGEIDCGGLEYVLIRYGGFFQFVQPLASGGHVSVAIEKGADVMQIVEGVSRELAEG